MLSAGPRNSTARHQACGACHKLNAAYVDVFHFQDAEFSASWREPHMTIDHRDFCFTQVVRTSFLLASMVVCVLTGPARAQDSTSATANETQRTAAGAIATDDHWSLAEGTGDIAYLDQMLLPEYRSVDADGTAYSKEQLLRGAAKRSGTSVATAMAKIAAYKRAHPSGTSVAIHDNTAILSFYDSALGAQKGIRSSDIFVYTDGRWHAIYSQHIEAGKK